MESSSPLARRQAEKSARARLLICEATVRCLYEHGYHDTSINRIVAQVGLSKGALQYHFPSKEELMAETVAFLLARPLQLHAEGPPAAIRTELRSLWGRMMNTRAYRALLEVLTAARTDRLLKARITPHLESSIQAIDQHFARRYDGLSADDERELALLLCANRCFMRGLLIEDQYGLSTAATEAVLTRWLDLLVPKLEALEQKP